MCSSDTLLSARVVCSYYVLLQVNSMFSHDWMKRLDVHIPDLLANGTQVLIYAGDLDL